MEPLVEVLWRQVLADRPLDTPERRAGFRKDLGEAVKGFKKGMQDEDDKNKPAPRLPDANRTDEAAQRERERDDQQR